MRCRLWNREAPVGYGLDCPCETSLCHVRLNVVQVTDKKLPRKAGALPEHVEDAPARNPLFEEEAQGVVEVRRRWRKRTPNIRLESLDDEVDQRRLVDEEPNDLFLPGGRGTGTAMPARDELERLASHDNRIDVSVGLEHLPEELDTTLVELGSDEERFLDLGEFDGHCLTVGHLLLLLLLLVEHHWTSAARPPAPSKLLDLTEDDCLPWGRFPLAFPFAKRERYRLVHRDTFSPVREGHYVPTASGSRDIGHGSPHLSWRWFGLFHATSSPIADCEKR